jgi:hypothetical protein
MRKFWNNPAFKEFVRLRRIWFLIVFVCSLVVVGYSVYDRDRSIVEIVLTVPLTIIGSLVLTTAISILSIPFVALVVFVRRSRARRKGIGSETDKQQRH